MTIPWSKVSRGIRVASSAQARATVERDSGGWVATITDADGREVRVRNFGSRWAAQRWAARLL